ncbi:hypothetical protein [Ornithobacterium rhinotracheale]|uniref:hypothetical protein n=1 Tax=Ornithobacterium rhinotracheale TaxID=28251 RepID=UPI001FF3BEC7|nr:hypothetical protein [Ornithobacterium rhinotracheale]MCK0201367.1 hypothetical protein [Ornithobacterium rhinotracheale]
MENPNVDKLKVVTELIAKKPIAFVGAVFAIMFWGFFIWSQRRIEYNSHECEKRYEREREYKEDLVNALLIKNGVIDNLREEKKKQDSIIKEITIDDTQKLLDYEK